MLHLRLFGPEGIKSMEWLDVWSHSLKRCLDIQPTLKECHWIFTCQFTKPHVLYYLEMLRNGLGGFVVRTQSRQQKSQNVTMGTDNAVII